MIDIDDICDMNEALMVRAENERRAQKAAESKHSSKGGFPGGGKRGPGAKGR